MAVRSRTVLERVFSIYSGIPNTSKPFKCICQRSLSQAQATDAKKLPAMVVGLGNYTLPNTRHSVGMLVVDCLSQQLGASWQFNRSSLGHVAVTKVNNRHLIMLKPTLAMNVNGKSISRAAAMFDVNPCNVILVDDDLDKPVGNSVLKHGVHLAESKTKSLSTKGHNGVRSAIASLGRDVSILKTVSIWQLVCQHAKDGKLTRDSSKFMPYCDTGGEVHPPNMYANFMLPVLVAQIVTGNH